MSVDLTKEGERCGDCPSNKAFLECKVEGCAVLEDVKFSVIENYGEQDDAAKKTFCVFEAKENNVTVRFRHDELTHKGVMKFHKGDLIIFDEKDFERKAKKTEKPFGVP